MQTSEILKSSIPTRCPPTTWPGRCGGPLYICPKRTQLSVVPQQLNMKSKPNSKPISATANPIQSQFGPLHGSCRTPVTILLVK